MLRRLRIYFTGFAIGLILVYVIFSKDDSRDLDVWTPSQRILEEIRNDSVLLEGETMRCYQACLGLKDSMLMSLWKDSKVKSVNPGGNPYKYLISLKTENHHFEAEIIRDTNEQQSLSYIKDNQDPRACDCR